MFNRYPLWKYLLILMVLAIGSIYSAPSLYPDDPTAQISGASTALRVAQADVNRTTKALTGVGITVKVNSLSKKGGLIRLIKQDDQLPIKEVVRRTLGNDYVVALNLAQTAPKWLRELGGSPVKLGLDLSGGVHFLLEVDMDKAVDVRLEVYESEVKSLLREERARYRNLPIQDRAIQPGFTDSGSLDKARSLITKDFHDFKVVPEERDSLQVPHVTLTQAKLVEIRECSIKQNLTTVRNRVSELGVSGPLVQCQGANRIVVELPGVQGTAEAKRILGKIANFKFRLAAESDTLKSATETFEFRGPRRPPVPLKRRVIIADDQITDTSASFDEDGRPQVNIRLDGHGGELMNRTTRDNVDRSMAVVFIEQKPVTRYTKQMVDGIEEEVAVPTFKEEKQIISLAAIQSPLGNQFRITGLDGPDESSELALLLRAGGLAAPVYFTEGRTIGPGLEADSVAKGVNVSLWGMFSISLSIIVIYHFFGMIATAALAFNMVMLVALMLVLDATLTLPDIADVVLTIGMAVDANALIFSRIREELASNISVQRAIHEDFNRAFAAILDADLTSLLVGGILYAMGTGPMKGFTVTMSLGIITSMLTAIMVTRVMVNLIFDGHDFKKPRVQGD